MQLPLFPPVRHLPAVRPPRRVLRHVESVAEVLHRYHAGPTVYKSDTVVERMPDGSLTTLTWLRMHGPAGAWSVPVRRAL